MRIAVYNQMFGLDGRSFFRNLYGHYLVHYQSNPKKVLKTANLNNTIREVRNSKADALNILSIDALRREKTLTKLLGLFDAETTAAVDINGNKIFG